MSGNRGRPPRSGEIRRYTGVVIEAFDQGVANVRVDGLGDTPFEAVEQVSTSVMLWTPFVGQRVVVEERASSNAQDQPEIVGLEFDVFAEHPWRRENTTVLVSPDGNIGVVIDGGTAAIEDGGDVDAAIYVGRDGATEPAVIGDQQETWLGGVLDELDAHKTTDQAIYNALVAFAAGLAAATDPAVITAGSNLTTALGLIAPGFANLDYLGKKTTISDHHSTLVFVSEE